MPEHAAPNTFDEMTLADAFGASNRRVALGGALIVLAGAVALAIGLPVVEEPSTLLGAVFGLGGGAFGLLVAVHSSAVVKRFDAGLAPSVRLRDLRHRPDQYTVLVLGLIGVFAVLLVAGNAAVAIDIPGAAIAAMFSVVLGGAIVVGVRRFGPSLDDRTLESETAMRGALYSWNLFAVLVLLFAPFQMFAEAPDMPWWAIWSAMGLCLAIGSGVARRRYE